MGVVGGRIQVGGMRRSSGELQCTGRRQSEVVLTSSNLELTTLPTRPYMNLPNYCTRLARTD